MDNILQECWQEVARDGGVGRWIFHARNGCSRVRKAVGGLVNLLKLHRGHFVTRDNAKTGIRPDATSIASVAVWRNGELARREWGGLGLVQDTSEQCDALSLNGSGDGVAISFGI